MHSKFLLSVQGYIGPSCGIIEKAEWANMQRFEEAGMKKYLVCIFMLIAMGLTGCAMDFDTKIEQDGFVYYCSDTEAFVYKYMWNGEEDSMSIEIPDYVDGKEVISVGGYHGRGVPCQFTVALPENIVGEGEGLNPYDITSDDVDETIYFDFNVNTDLEVEGYIDEKKSYYKIDDKIIEYVVRITINKNDEEDETLSTMDELRM